MRSKLKLVYFEDCPNAKVARANLSLTGQQFEEFNQDLLSVDHPLKRFSSPSILFGESLLFGSEVSGDGGCSLGVPSANEISARLKEISASPTESSRVVASTGSLGSILLVVLCPLCKPALAALFGALGLGYFTKAEVVRSVLIALLALTAGGFFFSYLKIHKRLAPFFLSVVMSVAIYLGRYGHHLGELENGVLTYSGIAGLIFLSVWNFTLKKPSAACGACVK